jgi:hypothetical protein
MPSPAATASTRARDVAMWFLIVVGTFAALIGLAYAAFTNAPPIQVLVSSSTAAGLAGEERTVRESPVATQIPEDARDIRILWRPSTGEFAGAWHGSFDPAVLADCPVVQTPQLPDVAERIVRIGSAATSFDAYECADVVIARVADTTYAWSR